MKKPSAQLSLLDRPTYNPPPAFGGDTFQPKDVKRLSGQLLAVRDAVLDGKWRTLAEIQHAVGSGSEAAISARLRDLRKPQFGAYKVERRRRGDAAKGLHEYRVRDQKGPVG